VGAIPELRAPIFAGFFHVRGESVIDLTENGTSSRSQIKIQTSNITQDIG
jgi:hypothetical protein